MPKQPDPRTSTSSDIYKDAPKAVFVGTIEAVDTAAAIEAAVLKCKIDACA